LSLEGFPTVGAGFSRRGTRSVLSDAAPAKAGAYERSGADWLELQAVSPHRLFRPQTNDLVLQLRKRRISKVILGGMLANMCVESHLRDLLEQGFKVVVVKEATAAPRHPQWGYGYTAALINFAFLAHAVLSTDDLLAAMR
jgi:nicotinamidase-related amidase